MSISGRLFILLSRNVGPADGAPGELHVADECLDGRLADQTHEEQLRDEVRWDGS